jgi:phenylalanyl-tRNA synthetase beta chain
MNILISFNWLKEYLKTQASAESLGKYLSLCGPSVEKIEKKGNDFVFDIEVTTNRVDMMSILGIGREAKTILPQFGIKASFNEPKLASNIKPEGKSLPITIKDANHLCQRVLGIVMDNVKLGPSPKKIQDRLSKTGIRSLNNAVDITNYVMTEIGHPAHVFDYDRIKTKKLIIRKAEKGEKIVSLEAKEYTLKGGDIVIDDGTGSIIDLPGIIGTKNSIVTPKTKRVLFFIETNNPVQIRKSSMEQGIRTVAATLNEKGIDPELAKTALLRGIQLFKELTGAKIASKIHDIYPCPYQKKTVNCSLQIIKQRLGVDIKENKVKQILTSLGFDVKAIKNSKKNNTLNNQISFKVGVPSWRANDVKIAEDVVEEVARIYGYHSLPSILPPLYKMPKKPENTNFHWEKKVKQMLKNWGFTETYTYTFQSNKELEKFDLDKEKHLKLKNPLTKEWVFLRTNLLPSLLSVLRFNKGYKKTIKLFELSNVFLPQKDKLPKEKQILILILQKEKFYVLKGICETLLKELGIKNLRFVKIKKEKYPNWHPVKTALVKSRGKKLGLIGLLKASTTQNFELEKKVTAAYLDFENITSLATSKKTYKPIPKYPPIIEDLSFIISKKITTQKIKRVIKNSHPFIVKVKLKSIYKAVKTFEVHYQAANKSLKAEEAAKIRKSVVKNLKKLDLLLKGDLKT